ncbi:MAG: hypothetical protein NZ772_17535, partial [Cyanobacteria bacterium]|nr:hypothetical protein [Cyanobacteriota bacterium]
MDDNAMSNADVPAPEAGWSARSVANAVTSDVNNGVSSDPSLGAAHDAIDLYTSSQDQLTSQPSSSSPLVKTEIRLGSLDVSESLARLADVLKVDIPPNPHDQAENTLSSQEATGNGQAQPHDGQLTESLAEHLMAIAARAAADHGKQPTAKNQEPSPHDGTVDAPDQLSTLQHHQDVLEQLAQLEAFLNDCQAILTASPVSALMQPGESLIAT